MNREISGQVCKKFSNIKFHENPSFWSRVVPCGQKDGRTDGRTDKHDEANSRFSLFCERTQKTVHSICVQAGGNMLFVRDISPDFLVMRVTTLIKFELLQ